MATNEVNPNMQLGAGSAPVTAASAADKMRKLESVLARFEITVAEANELVVLEDYEMVVIADDSGPTATRWDELKSTVAEMVEIASCFDDSGIDVYFLNREPIHSVKHATDPAFVRAFSQLPQGTTPLTEAFERVITQHLGDVERKVLLFIFTDGVPNHGPERFKEAVRRTFRSEQGSRLKVQIMACTSDDDEIGWLNKLDKELKEVDVTDDYHSEAREVARAGLAKRFTRGDWCMKAMLGPVSRKFDQWDEMLKPPGTVECECSLM